MKDVQTKKKLLPERRKELLGTLKAHFEKNMNRHQGLRTGQGGVKAGKLWSLHEMETTGGEPDVVGHDKKTGEIIYFDCSAETPKGRTSVCYDPEGLDSRERTQT